MKISKSALRYMDYLANEIEDRDVRIGDLEKQVSEYQKALESRVSHNPPAPTVTATEIQLREVIVNLETKLSACEGQIQYLLDTRPDQPSPRETSLSERMKYLEGFVREMQGWYDEKSENWYRCQDALYTYGTDQSKP